MVFIAVDVVNGRLAKGTEGVSTIVGTGSPFFHINGFKCHGISHDFQRSMPGNIKLVAFERSTKTVLGLQLANYFPSSEIVIRNVVCSLMPGVGSALVDTFHRLVTHMINDGHTVRDIELESVSNAITFHERSGYRLRKSCRAEDAAVHSRLRLPGSRMLDVDPLRTMNRLIELTELGLGPAGCVIPPDLSPLQKRMHWSSNPRCNDGVFLMHRCMTPDAREYPRQSAAKFVRRRSKSRPRERRLGYPVAVGEETQGKRARK